MMVMLMGRSADVLPLDVMLGCWHQPTLQHGCADRCRSRWWPRAACRDPMQAPLPWELFELYRWCDGQAPERGGVQFFDAARLLGLRELRLAVQERHGPLHKTAEFAALAALPAGGSGEGGSRMAGSTAAGGLGSPGWGQAEEPAGPGSSGGAGASGRGAPPGEPPPAVLLPVSEEVRGRRRYCLDFSGRVWLASGFNTLPAAPSLSALIRRILT